MELTEKQLVQLKHGLENVEEPNRAYYPAILRQLDEKEDILGPLCSRCEHSELTMDIVSSGGNVSWVYLLLVSCRCSKTLKEYVTAQIYLDYNGVMRSVDEKERHYSKLTHKVICENYPMKYDAPAEQQSTQQTTQQTQQPVQQQQRPVQQQPVQQPQPVQQEQKPVQQQPVQQQPAEQVKPV